MGILVRRASADEGQFLRQPVEPIIVPVLLTISATKLS